MIFSHTWVRISLQASCGRRVLTQGCFVHHFLSAWSVPGCDEQLVCWSFFFFFFTVIAFFKFDAVAVWQETSRTLFRHKKCAHCATICIESTVTGLTVQCLQNSNLKEILPYFGLLYVIHIVHAPGDSIAHCYDVPVHQMPSDFPFIAHPATSTCPAITSFPLAFQPPRPPSHLHLISSSAAQHIHQPRAVVRFSLFAFIYSGGSFTDSSSLVLRDACIAFTQFWSECGCVWMTEGCCDGQFDLLATEQLFPHRFSRSGDLNGQLSGQILYPLGRHSPTHCFFVAMFHCRCHVSLQVHACQPICVHPRAHLHLPLVIKSLNCPYLPRQSAFGSYVCLALTCLTVIN